MAIEIADIIIGEAPEAARIRTLLDATAQDRGYEIVRVRFMGGEGRRTLQIMAERADGTMDVGGCAEVSRAFSAILDVEDPIASAYDLEVSSPGIDRPLTRAKDFVRFEGHEAKLETTTLIDGRRRFRGVLEGVEGDEILLRVALEPKADARVLGFAFGLVSDAKLVLSDELLRQNTKERAKTEDPGDNDVALDETNLNRGTN